MGMKSLRLVIVEDDETLSASLAECLEVRGHRVCAIAATERRAIEAAIHFRPDLLLLDEQLSLGSGLSVLDKVKPVFSFAHVFISANIAKILAVRPDSMMLQKPFRERELFFAVEYSWVVHNSSN
jgi:DNA-binding response OmpR family regulator